MISCIWLTCYFIMAENSWNCIYWFLELFSYLCPILAMVHSSIYGELNIFLKSGLVGCFQDITSKFHILTNWLSSFFGPLFWNVEQIRLCYINMHYILSQSLPLTQIVLVISQSYKLKIMRAAKKVSVIARTGSGILCRLNRDLLSLRILQV